MTDTSIVVRQVEATDRRELVELMRASRALHEPWIAPPTTDRMFTQYLERMREDDHCGLMVCRNSDAAIVGVVNINAIVRGTFLSASLGYYVGAPFAGCGYMTAGLRAAVRHAFGQLGLHRLEANIQPDNARSLALVRRCGFTREGISRQFLYIAGAWRDHERWAIRDERDTLLPGQGTAGRWNHP
jgi:ribosomal-protein-alanine N-acetyltransferase